MPSIAAGKRPIYSDLNNELDNPHQHEIFPTNRMPSLGDITTFFNQGWVGALIGILGVGVAIYQILKRHGAKPAYQYSGQKLLYSGGGILPNEVSVNFNGEPVPRISLTYIVFWNHGHSTIRGVDITEDYPLTFRFRGGEILKAEVIKKTRDAIGASAVVCQNNHSNIMLNFSFLDAADGFTLKVLHTCDDIKPDFSGVIMGVPEGVKCLGKINLTNYALKEKTNFFLRITQLAFIPSWTNITALSLIAFSGVFIAINPEYIEFASSNREISINAARFAIGISSSFYLLIAIFMWTRIRRRFPVSINIEEN